MKANRNYTSSILIIFSFAICISTQAQVVINEFSCANTSSLVDNFGEYEDWIELYNDGTSNVDLSGYFLSDKANNPTKWEIPAGTTINANDHLLFFASKRNTSGGGNFHTNFKITQTKPEYIVLADPTGAIVDSIHITTPNQENHSWGRTINGAATWDVFTNPTPNANNTGAFQDYASTPQFSIAPGLYTSTQNITLTSPDPNVQIRYTINGNEPTATSPLYTSPIPVATTTVVRARAFSSSPNILPSFIETNTYFINTPHTLKVISICGDQVDNLLNGNAFLQPPGALEYFDENQVLIDEGTGEYNKHGNDSWAYQQRGFDFIMRDQFGYNYALKDQIFENKTRDKFQRIILKAAANDNYPFENGAHIRDAYVHQLSQNANLDMDERSNEPCVVYLNGQYWGVYEIREKVDDTDFTDYYYDQDRPNLDFLKTWGGTWAEYGSTADWNALVAYVNANPMTVDANYQYVKSVYNTNSLIDYFIMNTYVVAQDWLNWNTAWWRGTDPNGGRQKWTYTLWDMDATFDHYINYTGIPDPTVNADPCDPQGLGDPGGQGHIPIFNKLLTNDDFVNDYINRFADLSNTYFSCDYMIGLLDSMIAEIDPEMPGQIARWGGSYAQWQNNVQDLRNFILTRCQIINQGIVDCYQPDISGPYDIIVDVEPANGGHVVFSNVNLSQYGYPWSATYFGGVEIPILAAPNAGFVFSHWEANGNMVNPDTLTAQGILSLFASDSLIAHFAVPKQLVVDVNPPGGGTIDLNGTSLNTFAWSSFINAGTDLNFTATPSPFYTFSHWTAGNHTFTPSDISNPTSFVFNDEDTVVAHFIVPNYFMYDVEPQLSGEITVNGSLITNYPSTATYSYNTALNLEASPLGVYIFDYWEANHHLFTPNPEQQTVSLNTNVDDTIIAHFIIPNIPLEMPNVFTPNNDNSNDTYVPFDNPSLVSGEIIIFNRWGNIVHQSSDVYAGWNGKSGGTDAPDGTYFYTVNYTNLYDEEKSIAGSFTLRR